MGIVTVTQEHCSPIPPVRMFNASVADAHNLLPKILPQVIKSIVPVSGEGGPGSVEQINFTDGSPFKYAKHRLDELDVEKRLIKYTLIEGDALSDKLEFVSHEIKFEASSDGGCVLKMVTHYHTKEGIEIDEEEIKAGKEQAVGMYKVVEAYLTENPTAYA